MNPQELRALVERLNGLAEKINNDTTWDSEDSVVFIEACTPETIQTICRGVCELIEQISKFDGEARRYSELRLDEHEKVQRLEEQLEAAREMAEWYKGNFNGREGSHWNTKNCLDYFYLEDKFGCTENAGGPKVASEYLTKFHGKGEAK